MDLEVRKIHFVQEFLSLNNEQIIHKLEDMLRTEKSKLYKHSQEPMSLDEFNSMIDRAEEDSKNGRMRSASDLKKDIQSWE